MLTPRTPRSSELRRTFDATAIPAIGVTDMAIGARYGTDSAVILGGTAVGDNAPAPANTAITAPAAADVSVDTADGASVAPDVGADMAVGTAAGVWCHLLWCRR